MSGTGKSCAIRGLAKDRDIQHRYKGGVYLLSLGQNATPKKINEELLDMMVLAGASQAATKLRPLVDKNDSMYAILKRVVAFFEGQHCLFLIDDVTMNDIQTETLKNLARLAECSDISHVILTTTSRDILSILSLAKEKVEFEPLEVFSKEARNILLRVAGSKKQELNRNAERGVREVLRRCAGLHVALALAGSGVRAFAPETSNGRMRNKAWSKYLRVYSGAKQLLAKCSILGYPGLRQTFVTSLKILQSQWEESIEFKTIFSMSKMFRSLCVLDTNQWVCLDVLRKLWKLGNIEQAEIVVRRFQERNLVTVITKEIRNVEHSNQGTRVHISKKIMTFVHMHTLVHEFTRLMTEEMDGENGIRNWHRRILNHVLRHNSESKKTGLRSWWDCRLANVQLVGYGRKFDVEYHLRCADLGEELSLLRKEERWLLSSNIKHSERELEIKKDDMKINFPYRDGNQSKRQRLKDIGTAESKYETEMEAHIGSQASDFSIVIEGTNSSGS